MKTFCMGLVMALFLGAAAARVEAAIVGTTGAVVQIAPPATLEWQMFESNTEIRAFDELQNQTLGASLAIDIDGSPGTYNSIAGLTGGSLASGTVVNSHLLHLDSASGTTRLSGSITFDAPIIGVMVLTNQLYGSDFLGVPGTMYPAAGLVRRGLDLGDVNNLDSVTISADRLTLTLDIASSNVIDEVRVLTAIPEPMSAALLGAAGLVLCMRRPTRRG